MKKIVTILFSVLVLLLIGCSSNDELPMDDYEVLVNDYNVVDDETNAELDYTEILLKELGEIIVSAGEFWEHWWKFYGRFDQEHIDTEDRVGRFVRLLPSSGFANLDNIREYLLQYLTENLVDFEMRDEWFPFREYDGMLYLDDTRTGGWTNDWRESARHELIEQDDNHVIIQTMAHPCHWWEGSCQPGGSTPIYHFTFINGRIDAMSWGSFQPNTWFAGIDEDDRFRRGGYEPLVGEWRMVGTETYSEQDNEWHFELATDMSMTHFNADGGFSHANGGGIWAVIDGSFIQEIWIYHIGRPFAFELDGDYLFFEQWLRPDVRTKYVRVGSQSERDFINISSDHPLIGSWELVSNRFYYDNGDSRDINAGWDDPSVVFYADGSMSSWSSWISWWTWRRYENHWRVLYESRSQIRVFYNVWRNARWSRSGHDYYFEIDGNRLILTEYNDDGFSRQTFVRLGEARNLTLDELGRMVVRAGNFWNDWWLLERMFSNLRSDESINHRNFTIFQSDRFSSLSDVENYLSNYFTDSWIDFALREMANPPFMSHDTGEVLVHFERGNSTLDFPKIARPDWTTATHELVEESDGNQIVQTIVTRTIDGEVVNLTFTFTFENGRIRQNQPSFIWYGLSVDEIYLLNQ